MSFHVFALLMAPVSKLRAANSTGFRGFADHRLLDTHGNSLAAGIRRIFPRLYGFYSNHLK